MNPILRKISFVVLIFGLTIGVTISLSLIFDGIESQNNRNEQYKKAVSEMLSDEELQNKIHEDDIPWILDADSLEEFERRCNSFDYYAKQVNQTFSECFTPGNTIGFNIEWHVNVPLDITGGYRHEPTLEERIEILEEYHAVPGNPRAEFGSGELIPEPGHQQTKNQEVQS